jgi:hypothetical protein
MYSTLGNVVLAFLADVCGDADAFGTAVMVRSVRNAGFAARTLCEISFCIRELERIRDRFFESLVVVKTQLA